MYIRVYIYVYTYVSMYVYGMIYICVCVCVCVCVCISLCMYKHAVLLGCFVWIQAYLHLQSERALDSHLKRLFRP